MYQHHSIAQFHQEIEGGLLTCNGVVEDYLERINRLTHLNAYLEVFAEEARERARLLDLKKKQGEKTGKLFGVVIGIKDVIAFKHHKLSAASRILANYESVYSSTAVQRLLDEDAIIIGRLNCDEFAMGSSNEFSAFGKVLNGLDEERVPGGSSGGSAVAVQMDLCMVALGSDTGGSVRQPADFCGVIGLKPSYGRISRYGLIAYASSFDQIGLLGKKVEDIALLLETMAGMDEFDSTCSLQPVPHYSESLDQDPVFRIAYFKESLEHPSLDPEISSGIKSFLNKAAEAGHQVEALDFEFLDYIVPAYYILTTAEASTNLSRYDGIRYGYRTPNKVLDINELYKKTRSEGFGKEVKRRIMLGTFVLSAGYFDAYFAQAQKIRKIIFEKTQQVFNSHDILIMPTVPTPAFRFGEKANDPVEMFLADLFTVFANLAGIPAISIPLFRHSSGMPFGVQAMTNRFEELSLLQFSKSVLRYSVISPAKSL